MKWVVTLLIALLLFLSDRAYAELGGCALNASGLCSSIENPKQTATPAPTATPTVTPTPTPGMTGQLNGTSLNVATGLTRYLGLTATQAWDATESTVTQVMPIDGVLSTFRICLTTASGTGSRVYTLRKNSVDTVITTTITSATCNADTTHSVSVSAGDLVNLKQVTSGTLNSAGSKWAVKILAANANEYPLLMFTNSQIGIGATRYFDLQANSGGAVTEATAQYVFPTAGSVDRMFVKTDTNAVTNPLTVTLRLNGVDTALTASVAAGTSTQNNVSDSVNVVAGDIATLKFVNSGSALIRGTVGLRFRPTVNGEGISSYTNNATFAQNTTLYSVIVGSTGALNSEASQQQLFLAGTIKKLRLLTNSAIGGSGQTLILTARKNTANTALTCTANSGDTTCNDASNTVAIADDDLLALQYQTSATTGTIQQPQGSVVIVTTP